MKNRVIIEKTDLKKLYDNLIRNGYSAKKIDKVIGTGIRNFLYGRIKTIKREHLEKLEAASHSKIPSRAPLKDPRLNFSLKKDIATAEIVGIMLGDGSLLKNLSNRNKYVHTISVSLNGVDEAYFVTYVQLLLETTFGKVWHLYKRTTGKCVVIKTGVGAIFEAMLSIGLKSGNKVKNQVKVPRWIKEKQDFIIACLRGLLDTDGSISFRQFSNARHKYLTVSFKNSSLFLLRDFKEMCCMLGIDAHYCGKHSVQIQSRTGVKKFIEIIKPIKWIIFSSKHPEAQKILDRLDARKNRPKKKTIKHLRPSKFRESNITIDQLKQLIWEKPATEIAQEIGVSGSYVIRMCRKWHINKPSRGYWAKVNSR